MPKIIQKICITAFWRFSVTAHNSNMLLPW